MATLLIDVLRHYRSEQKYLLHKFVVTPNHVHLLLSPIEALARAMQFIKSGFSYRAKKELAINLEVWERGYVEHRVRDPGNYEHHVEHIRQNPVRARLATIPEAYPYCSASCSTALDPCPEGLKSRSSLIA